MLLIKIQTSLKFICNHRHHLIQVFIYTYYIIKVFTEQRKEIPSKKKKISC